MCKHFVDAQEASPGLLALQMECECQVSPCCPEQECPTPYPTPTLASDENCSINWGLLMTVREEDKLSKV